MALLERRFKSYPTSGQADWKTWFYLVAQLIGSAGLTVLLLTMLWPTRRRKPRNPVLVSLCFSWWFSTFPCLLILYYARQVTGPPPTHAVCLTSAVLTMSQSVLVAMTALALILHIWLAVQTAVKSGLVRAKSIGALTVACMIFPWVVTLLFGVAILSVGLQKPEIVHRALFYCIVDDDSLTMSIGIFGSIAIVTAIILEIWIVVLLSKNRESLRQLSRGRNGLDVSLIIRVCIFGLYVLLGLCLETLSIVDWTNPIPDMFFATFSIGVFLVFGTQPDIWRIWRDVSRHVTSSRSISFSSPHQDSSRHPATFSMSSPSSPSSSAPQPSLMRSVSFADSKRSPIPMPLPAAFRPRDAKTPPLVIHTTTEVISHTEASTPTTNMSHMGQDSPFWGRNEYHQPKVDFDADSSYPPEMVPTPQTQASFPASVRDDDGDSMVVGNAPQTADLYVHSYPPTPGFLNGWILQPPIPGEPRASLAPSEAPPTRGESPVWDLELEAGHSDEGPHAL